jgi:hypothetical protein
MDVPNHVLTISKSEGASRQVDEAINALQRGDFDIAITLSGAAEGMFESPGQDLWAAMLEKAQAAKIPRKDITEDLNNARNWLKHTGGSDDYAFDSYLAKEMILRAIGKIERESWTPRMKDFVHWLVTRDRLT